ncbi:hypothetical protein ACFL1T_00385 [Chlamydiota bacterium]
MIRGIKQGKQAVTIVEIFIVLSIIAVLASFLVGGALRARQKHRNVMTYVLLDSVAVALELYKTDFGEYPPDSSIEGTNRSSAACLYYYLGATFVNGMNADTNAGPYTLFDSKKQLSLISTLACDFDGDGITNDSLYEVIDGWENPIQYLSSNPLQNSHSYDIYSNGTNKVDNSGDGDDINNWD